MRKNAEGHCTEFRRRFLAALVSASVRRGAVAAICVVASVVFSPGEAEAAGLVDFLFGTQPPSATADSNPILSPPLTLNEPPAGPAGAAVTYCVRLCDGRYFPVARNTGATSAQLCGALCPAARTKIFSGSDIARARAPDGTRYSDLPNAFVYRKELVPDCTCNGKDVFGTAPVDVASDPTLRAGDLVATEDGTVKFTGSRDRLRQALGLPPVNASVVTQERRRLATAATAARGAAN